MSATKVRPGQTFALSGTLGPNATLTGLAGHRGALQGALINVATAATNDGTIDLLAGPSHPGVSGATGAELLVSGVLINLGVIDIAGSAYGSGSAGAVAGAIALDQGYLKNEGTMLVGGAAAGSAVGATPGSGGTLIDSGVLINTGVLNVAGGSSGYSTGGTVGGTLDVTGPELVNSGRLIVSGGSSDSGQTGSGGLLKVSAASIIDNSGRMYVGASSSSNGGTFIDYGVLINSSTISLAGYSGGGVLSVESSATFDNSGSFNVSSSLYENGYAQIAGTMVNTGTVTLYGGRGFYFRAGHGASISVTGILTNENLITVRGGYGYDGVGTSPFYAGGGASLTVEGTLINDGSLVVDAVYNYGTAGNLTDVGSITNAGTITLDGSGYGYARTSGGTLAVLGSLTNTGSIMIEGGLNQFNAAGAVLSDSGVLTNMGTISVLGGQYTPFQYKPTGGTFVVNGQLINSGRIILQNGTSGSAAGTLSISAGATLTDSGSISHNGVLINQGTVLAQNGGEITTASLINDGTIQVAQNASFLINSVITNNAAASGVLNLSSGTDLTLDRSVASNELVAFIGNEATLTLGDAHHFAGVLEGLGAASLIDLVGLDATSAVAQGTTLTVDVAGQKPLHLTLSAPLAAGTTLQLTTDQHGGTDLLIQSPGG